MNAKDRLEPYLMEAESLRLMDAIGAPLYRFLDAYNNEDDTEYTRPDGVTVTLTNEQYHALMYGGYYTLGNCGDKYAPGIVYAISYIAYARFLVNNPINITAFGVRYKDGEFSSRVEDNAIVRASNDAQRIGEAYLEQVVEMCAAYDLLPCKQYTEAPRHIVRIGQKKL
jgi:hypothetical protein